MNIPGRREQNKQKTRKAIEDAAAHLFDEHGFANTTIRDVARAAGVGERTLFRYFPTKESLVSGQVRELIPRLAQLLLDRPADEPPYTAMRNAVLTLADQHDVPPAIFITGPPRRFDPDSRTDRFLLSDLEAAVTDALERRLAASAPDADPGTVRLQAAVKARAGVAALRALVAVHADQSDTIRTIGQLTDFIEDAFAALNSP
ncbi:TetR/AcrR family transcriptional regulator [Streptomyces sp. NPDC048297]|uniref:TetR/AcrR family transcriptional regulator n=1 Tax=Streptomyces sp. NPDC048297 TaxID=3365531 RepID=UPI00371C244F